MFTDEAYPRSKLHSITGNLTLLICILPIVCNRVIPVIFTCSSYLRYYLQLPTCDTYRQYLLAVSTGRTYLRYLPAVLTCSTYKHFLQLSYQQIPKLVKETTYQIK